MLILVTSTSASSGVDETLAPASSATLMSSRMVSLLSFACTMWMGMSARVRCADSFDRLDGGDASISDGPGASDPGVDGGVGMGVE